MESSHNPKSDKLETVNLLTYLEKKSRPFKILLGFSLIAGVGILDFLSGFEFGFSVFYIIPIALITWLIGRAPGIIASFVSTLVWQGVDIISGQSYSHPLIPIWNALIRLSFFVIITLLLSELKKAMDNEKELARTDFLTGAINSRFFFELLQMEIDRSKRYKRPFSLAYIDLDNFKSINDRFGHQSGDRVLSVVVDYARNNLRKTDVVARLGGDEFVLLLPETNRESAPVTLSKLQKGLLEEMQRYRCEVTFSIGVLICSEVSASADELIKVVDSLMFQVKREGKNAIKYATFPG
jgi:diguanylate cyclase (GGDEF)-like protein